MNTSYFHRLQVTADPCISIGKKEIARKLMSDANNIKSDLSSLSINILMQDKFIMLCNIHNVLMQLVITKNKQKCYLHPTPTALEPLPLPCNGATDPNEFDPSPCSKPPNPITLFADPLEAPLTLILLPNVVPKLPLKLDTNPLEPALKLLSPFPLPRSFCKPYLMKYTFEREKLR